MSKPRAIQQVFMAMCEYYRHDPARIQHFTKVHSYCRFIGLEEELDDRTLYTLELAALVHDIGIKKAEAKYGSSMGKYQEELGPDEARQLLGKFGIEPEIIERIAYLVGHHHTYTNIDGIDYQILVEADFLVNIFEDRLAPKAAQAVKQKIFKTVTALKLHNAMFAAEHAPS